MFKSARRFAVSAVILGLVLGLGATLAAQADPFVGTWVLNVEKSEFNTGGGAAVRSRTLVITAKPMGVFNHTQDTYRQGNDAVTKIVYDAKYDGTTLAKVTGAAFEEVSFKKTGNTMVRTAKNRGMDVETATYTLSPDGKTLWVTSIPQNAVFVYDLAKPMSNDMQPIDTIKLPDIQIPGRQLGGAVANWVTFTPDGQIYISNSGLRSVTAINVATRKINAVVPVGEVPKRIGTLVMR